MANCTATEVKTIITTGLTDPEVTALIVLADAEITARGLDTRNSSLLKTISMLITADLISARAPPTLTLSPMGYSNPMPTWRQKAEALILRSGTPPIVVSNDPVETDE